jgi:hypothetical protein
MEPFELIFNNDEKQGIHSGGFSVNSVMLKKGISPLKTLNFRRDFDNDDDDDDLTGGGSQVADLFNSLVVPNWAFTEGKMFGSGGSSKNYENDDEVETVEEELHEKLLELVKHNEANKKKEADKIRGKKTRKNVERSIERSIERNIGRNGGTKKNKK